MKQDRILFVTAVSAGVAPPALATPASGFTAVQQWKGDFAAFEVKTKGAGDWEVELKTDEQSDVDVVRNSIAIDGQSGWHRHPGPSLITVTVGEITAYES